MTETALGWWVVPIAVLGGALRVSTPFLFVSLGECITERSGRIISASKAIWSWARCAPTAPPI